MPSMSRLIGQSIRMATWTRTNPTPSNIQIRTLSNEVFHPIYLSQFSDADFSDPRFAVITALILTASYSVAMTVASLDRVLAFVGSTGSTAISFILPGIFYHRMTRPGGLLPRAPEDSAKDDDDDDNVSVIEDDASHESSSTHSSDSDSTVGKRRATRKKIRRGAAVALVVYGFVVMTVCLTINIVVGKGGH